MYHTTFFDSGQSPEKSQTELQENTGREGCRGCDGCKRATGASATCCAFSATENDRASAEGGSGERSDHSHATAEGAPCLSTFHPSPFFPATAEGRATERSEADQRPPEGGQKRTWEKKSVACWDYGEHPDTGQKFYYRTETEVNVPIEAQTGEVEEITPKMIIALNGGLAKVVKGREKVTVEQGDKKKPGNRGIIETFSAGARRRLMRLLAKTDQRDRPLFCTLTYPDVYPESPETVKRHLDNFGKRLLRKFPNSAFVWRVETVERKSGVNAGKIAPHFHLLLWGVPFGELAEWLPVAWNSVVFKKVEEWGGAMIALETEKTKHFNVHNEPGKAVQALKSWKGVMYYASKYIGKKDDTPVVSVGGGIPDVWEWTGKHWGIVGRDNLPLSVVLVVDILQGEAIKATRTARKMIGLAGRDLMFGITWFIGGAEAQRYLAWLLGDTGNPPKGLQLSGADAKELW